MSRRLAFLGPAGTHTEQACLSYDPEASLLPYPSLPAAAAAVDSGQADECMVAIENSLGGSVAEALDLLIHQSSLSIRNEVVLPITHCLVASDSTATVEIETVYSHPQALAQCQAFLSRYLPKARRIASMSTASAVEEVLKSGKDSAAIAAERAADLYGAKVLARGIEDNPSNMTRFVVLAPKDHPPTGTDKTSVSFSFDEDAPGVLYTALGEFALRRINLTKIESRPTRESLGRYIFLVDLEGHREDDVVREALEGLADQVSTSKVLGSYPRSSLPR